MPFPQIKQSIDVAGTFDNCFFHAYALYLLANQLPFPENLFSFQSIIGQDSLASQLQKNFNNFDDLELFAQYHQLTTPDIQPLSSHFLVEKTLILGCLLREWFATTMLKNQVIADNMLEHVVQSFKTYRDFRKDGVAAETLLLGNEGVLYLANQDVLETNTQLNDDNAIKTYWQKEGYARYCRQIATCGTKLSSSNLLPIVQILNQAVIIYNASNKQPIIEYQTRTTTNILQLSLNVAEGHYHLLQTTTTNSLLTEYENSLLQYKHDREVILQMPQYTWQDADKKNSLLLRATLPTTQGHDRSVDLLDRVRDMKQFVNTSKAKQEQEEQQKLILLQAQELAKQEELAKQRAAEQAQRLAEQQHAKLVQEKYLLISTPTVKSQRKLFYHQLTQLQEQVESLWLRKKKAQPGPHKENLKNAYDTAQRLHTTLKTQADEFFNPERIDIDYEQFSSTCKGIIKDARTVLNQHRGYIKPLLTILMNMSLILVVIGRSLIAGECRFFKLATKTSGIVENLEKTIDHFKLHKLRSF